MKLEDLPAEVAQNEYRELDTNQQLFRHLDSLYQSGKFNGVALFYKEGKKSTHVLGHRRLDKGDSLKPSDVFQLASLSKPFAALAILKLAQEGRIDLDAPLNQYLFDFPNDMITVRSLLNHTSGMGNYMYVTDSLWSRPDSLMRNENVYDLVRCDLVPQYHQPLKRFSYCNTNYALLPMLVEQITGLTFARYMHQEVFQPLGMDSTHWLDAQVRSVDHYPVLGHYPNGDANADHYLNTVVGDKSLYSSVDDLFTFYRAYREGRVIDLAWVEAAMSPEVRSGKDQYYGLGWRIKKLGSGETLVFHNGWWRGFRSYFWMSSTQDKVAIVLTNSIGGGYLRQEKIWSLF